MPGVFNRFQQPVGIILSNWKGAPFPRVQQITGRYCKPECISTERHAKELYEVCCETSDCRDWTHPAAGPFETFDASLVYLKNMKEQTGPVHFAVVDLTSMKPVGTFALIHIDPTNDAIEVGHVSYSICMKRTQISMEVISLPSKYVSEDLGYHRFEWKCDAPNTPSRGAAERFGLSSESIFRQAIVTHGRDRDTIRYSIIDGEYPTLQPAYDLWLDESNFDSQGWQIRRLDELMERG